MLNLTHRPTARTEATQKLHIFTLHLRHRKILKIQNKASEETESRLCAYMIQNVRNERVSSESTLGSLITKTDTVIHETDRVCNLYVWYEQNETCNNKRSLHFKGVFPGRKELYLKF
jgi:hypothetical protein